MSITTRGVVKHVYNPDGTPAVGASVQYDLAAASGFPYCAGGLVIPRSVVAIVDSTGLSRAELWCNESESEVDSWWRAILPGPNVSTRFSVPIGEGDAELDVLLQDHGDPLAPNYAALVAEMRSTIAATLASCWRGPWNVDDAYSAADLASDAGSTYVARRVNTGVQPSLSPDDWYLVAAGQ